MSKYVHVSTGAHGGQRCWIPSVAGVTSDFVLSEYCELNSGSGKTVQFLTAEPSF